ncbi:hypothetical protein CORC01_01344 [Colletotrichum orchidophilum]|uniref:Uncharacterized protein n=1 Tax=Colletotrichum orchidophilum TaxID=1209926 RepID=A0A1G4BPA1_9PEZI|nr:uncharacterized protein CORC01_01344 [Colletotrichum orchidophilum]OHF03291.1 hypothetical protein CORC01_01344 [Colletotrichum orchidophilum]
MSGPAERTRQNTRLGTERRWTRGHSAQRWGDEKSKMSRPQGSGRREGRCEYVFRSSAEPTGRIRPHPQPTLFHAFHPTGWSRARVRDITILYPAGCYDAAAAAAADGGASLALQDWLIYIHDRRRRRDRRHDRGYGLETGIDGCRNYRSCLDSDFFFGGCGRYRGHHLHVSEVAMVIESMILNGFGICFHHHLWTEEQPWEIGLGNVRANGADRCLIWGRNEPEVAMHPVGGRSDRMARVRFLRRRGIRPGPFHLDRL